MHAQQTFNNEVFQLGGYKLMRGFDEESIFATAFAVGTAEYRYLIGLNSYLFAFGDYGWARNDAYGVAANHTYLGLGAGIAFELPMASWLLSKIGLITPGFLRSYRKYAYVALLFIAAVITPSPDWGSQTVVVLPLVLLYEISIIISARVVKDQARRDKEEWS